MNIRLLVIAKTQDERIKTLCQEYGKRLKYYVNFKIEILSLPKKKKFANREQQQEAEGKLILTQLSSSDIMILLDETGKEFSSREFARWIEKKQNQSVKNLVFVIGGPYGVSQAVKQSALQTIALSKMTFSHQMVRLIFVEQLYRAYTIIKGESYHH